MLCLTALHRLAVLATCCEPTLEGLCWGGKEESKVGEREQGRGEGERGSSKEKI